MYSKYIVFIDNKVPLPERISIISRSWGEDIPISFSQDNEVLNDASYLDLKVNKWEANSKWSEIQNQEPWIRVEIYRDEQVGEFVLKNKLRLNFDCDNYFLLVIGLDDGWQEIDQILLGCIVKATMKSYQTYGYDDTKGYIICHDYLNSLPSKDTVRQYIFLACNPGGVVA